MLRVEQILRNEEGKNVLKDSFETIIIKANYIIVKKEEGYGLYKLCDYKQILNCEWDKITFEGEYIVASRYSQFAVFDSEGKPILKCNWDKVVLYENGILVSKNKVQGFFNYNGDIILDCVWKRIEPFHNVLLAFRGNGAKRMTFDYDGNIIEDK